jgi:phospholipid transport system transporter-binding protein
VSKVIRVDTSRMAVQGDMLVQEAVTLRTEGEALLASLTSPVTVDLAGAGNVGSVGVSVLLCWMRKAEALGKRLVVVNMPDKMRDVSRVSGLDELLSRS